MRRFFSAMALAGALSAGATTVPAEAGVGLTLSIGDTDGFYTGVGNYYGIPQQQIYSISQRGIPYYDVPVLLYIAQRANVDPYMVANLRQTGMSWMDVSHYFGLGADIYYVQANPYGSYTNYYQPFLSHPRSSWSTLSLSDVAIVNLTNLLWSSQHYGVSPYEVMRWRTRGDNFLRINRNLFTTRGEIPLRPLRRSWNRPLSLPVQYRERAVELGRRRGGGRFERQSRDQVRVSQRVEERTRVRERAAEQSRVDQRRDNRAQIRQRAAEQAQTQQRREERAQMRQREAAQAQRAQERARDNRRQEIQKSEKRQTRREAAPRRDMRSRNDAQVRQSSRAQKKGSERATQRREVRSRPSGKPGTAQGRETRRERKQKDN